MKISSALLLSLFSLILILPITSFGQKLEVDGEAKIGNAGNGNNLLTLASERNWIFRQFGTGSNTALELFDATGLKNFLISTSGNVGIDVLVPTAKLQVNGAFQCFPKISFGSGEFFEDAGSFLISCNGGLLSTTDALDDLGSSGKRWRNIFASDGMINTSDARAKKSIQNISHGLEEILQLHPISFVWKDSPDDRTKLGLIAQEVQQIIPEVVVDHDLERDELSGAISKKPAQQLGIYYSDLIPVLIKAIQDQQKIIVEEEARIAALENKMENINLLEERLARIEAELQGNVTINDPHQDLRPKRLPKSR